MISDLIDFVIKIAIIFSPLFVGAVLDGYLESKGKGDAK